MTPELTTLPAPASCALAQQARRRLRDALAVRDFARDCFEGWSNDVTYEAVIRAEIAVDDAMAVIGEFEC